ncbi:hypothetical protein BDU57DRAFT_510804 [Ampelomyces quisqualis]|uniref:Uncharacterized protein n=1 Tax=Ampelomyces quisqualis TaxID=50730 RepID=A0A6A5R195_AMPQU|nr:hypothetical protein BDU57DRAFT_510804 [Ampelomyces quisqualis]
MNPSRAKRRVASYASHNRLIAPKQPYMQTLRKELTSKIRERELEDEEFGALVAALKTTIDNARNLLDNFLSILERLPRGYTIRRTGAYREELRALSTSEANKALQVLDPAFYQRKITSIKIFKGNADEMSMLL